MVLCVHKNHKACLGRGNGGSGGLLGRGGGWGSGGGAVGLLAAELFFNSNCFSDTVFVTLFRRHVRVWTRQHPLTLPHAEPVWPRGKALGW